MQEQNGKNAILQHLLNYYRPVDGFVIEDKKPNTEPYLEDVLVYKHVDKQGGLAHWHYVTLGLSELYDKESMYEDISGFGIELTFRLVCGEEKTAPVWVKHFLENLAAYVFTSAESFEQFQCLDAGGVICQDVATKLTAVAFIDDKQLQSIDTPNGNLTFLQVIGLTAKELAVFGTEGYKEWLKKFTKTNYLGITDLMREEIL